MIARHEGSMSTTDIWTQLAAPLHPADMSFRQDGKPTQRDGKFFARFVAYWEWPVMFRRFQEVAPGEFDVTLDPINPGPAADADSACAFKARIQVLGVIRENVGYGKDVKQAATDAMKRTASLGFGVGLEVYDAGPFYVQVDGDGKYAKPVEDVATAFARKYGGDVPAAPAQPDPRAERRADVASRNVAAADASNQQAAAAATGEDVACPKCGGKTWDNRLTKKNPKAPNFKCRDRACDGVIWPEKEAKPAAKNGTRKEAISAGGPVARLDDDDEFADFPGALDGPNTDIPF